MEKVVRIESLVHGGDGLARDEGRVLFVPLAVPGDLARVAVDGTGEAPLRGRLLEVVEPGPQRVAPPCPHVGTCGGCDLQQLSFEGQQAAKARVVADSLERIGRLDAGVVRPLVPSPLPWRYRRRVRVQLVGDGFGYSMRASHKAVRVSSCLLAEEPVEALATAFAALLKKSGLPAIESFGVDVTGGRGAVHVALKEAAGPIVQAKAGRLLSQLRGWRGWCFPGRTARRSPSVTRCSSMQSITGFGYAPTFSPRPTGWGRGAWPRRWLGRWRPVHACWSFSPAQGR